MGDLTWCVRCGSYAASWAVGLAAPCAGAPSNQSQRRVRNRLLRGRHPRTNAALVGEVVWEVAGVGGTGNEEAARTARKGRRGIQGERQPRSIEGYLRRPGGAEMAFGLSQERAAEEAREESRQGGSRGKVEEAVTQKLARMFSEAIDEGEREAKRMKK